MQGAGEARAGQPSAHRHSERGMKIPKGMRFMPCVTEVVVGLSVGRLRRHLSWQAYERDLCSSMRNLG